MATSGYFRETIRQNIRQARERFSGQRLRQELGRLQRRLDSVELLSPDIVMNLLLSYRDVQVWQAQGYWHFLVCGFEQIVCHS